jgi:hypothetical protein
MKVGDLVRCWWSSHAGDFTQGPAMIGILMDVLDEGEDVMVYIASMENVYWFPKGDYEVINESR